MDKEDEMTCLIKGCNFVLKNIPHEAFVYAKHADSEFRFQHTHPDIFPYLLINIGSGVSIVKVYLCCTGSTWHSDIIHTKQNKNPEFADFLKGAPISFF